MRYLIVIKRTENGATAYCPNNPAVNAARATTVAGSKTDSEVMAANQIVSDLVAHRISAGVCWNEVNEKEITDDLKRQLASPSANFLSYNIRHSTIGSAKEEHKPAQGRPEVVVQPPAAPQPVAPAPVPAPVPAAPEPPSVVESAPEVISVAVTPQPESGAENDYPIDASDD